MKDDFLNILKKILNIKIKKLLFEKKSGNILKFQCKICGREFENEKSIEKHIQSKHSDEVVKIVLKEAIKGGSTKSIEGFNALIDNMDVKKIKELDVDIETAEGIARMFNEVFFHGDWKKHIEWIKKYGSEEQKREDIPLIEKIMKEDMKKKQISSH